MANPLGVLVLLLCALPVFATEDDALPDPTRPPLAVMKAAEKTGSGKPAAPSAVLQSVILRPGTKPAAIIAGERVELGGDYGGAKLVKISEQEVILEGPAGREVLSLTPAAQKRAANPDETKNSKKNPRQETRR